MPLDNLKLHAFRLLLLQLQVLAISFNSDTRKVSQLGRIVLETSTECKSSHSLEA